MQFSSGLLGNLPYASIGSGPPLIIFGGVAHVTGVESSSLVRAMTAPATLLMQSRTIYLINRWPNMPRGITMAQIGEVYAEALGSRFTEPVDIVGSSTGGSIAQQLAAQSPHVVNRLVLISTAYTLTDVGRAEQRHVAEAIRAGNNRRAAGLALAAVVPAAMEWPARLVGRLLSSQILISQQAANDLATTLEAEDPFDLSLLSPISAPTLIIGAGKDDFYPDRLFEQTRDLIPSSELLMYPKEGHVSVHSNGDVRAQISRFLAIQ